MRLARRTPFTARRRPFTTRGTPLTARRTPFTARPLPFTGPPSPAVLLVVLQLAVAPALATAQDQPAPGSAAEYVRSEYHIPMRDGVELFTAVYVPKEPVGPLPFLVMRTPYSCRPYGEGDGDPAFLSEWIQSDRYIAVCQDVRGRWMSDGLYDNMRPHVPGETPIDESSDTWDTIEWLLENVPGHNGKVGQLGISYPGFYAAAALPEAHPALTASSPQAPIADFWFDDFHHRGAYTLAYFLITPLFGVQKEGPTTEPWFDFPPRYTPDGYRYYMDLGPLSNADTIFGPENFFWRQLVEHPNYDAFWQDRDLLPHLRGIDHAVLTVGGLFDAEDLYGPFNIYRTIEEQNPEATNMLVMGPWSHGQWRSTDVHQMVGDIWFGDSISIAFMRDVEAPFFRHFLKGAGPAPDFEALVFDTGRKEWRRFDAWPPPAAAPARWYLRDREVLASAPPASGEAAFTEYVSDPNEPVPYTDRIRLVFTPRAYMTEDQRFAERRPDVIEFMTPPLEEDVTLVGEVLAHLEVSTTGTDADWVVKLIDVYPASMPNDSLTPGHIRLSGYQQMVRSEIQRGRFRNSFEVPEPFTPGEVATVAFPLQGVLHTFRKGHRIMVQVQSTWFPLFDRNPQTFVPNIFEAAAEDFVRATHRLHHGPGAESWIEVRVLQ